LLTVTTPHTVAMVDGKPTPSPTSRPTMLNLRVNINTQPNPELAHTRKPLQPMSQLTPTFHQTLRLLFWLLLLRVLSLSPSKLIHIHSKDTKVVFSTQLLVESTSIMPSLLSDMELKTDNNTILSETPGEPDGEKQDTLESPPLMDKVSAVSKWNPSTQHPTE
jgi:hypothetical protein